MRNRIFPWFILGSSIIAFGAVSAGANATEVRRPKDAYGLDARALAWNSMYAGMQGGYSWGDAESDALWGPVGAVENFSYKPEGATGGFHFGVSHRYQNVVIGLETDFEFGEIKGSGVGDVNAVHTLDIDWMGSLRGRIGITEQNTLLYLTGGLAYANIATSQAEFNGNPIPFVSHEDVRTGWTVGGGVEQLIAPQITARLEYRYTDFGRASYLDGAWNMQETNRIDLHSLRFGLSVHF